MQNEHVVGIIDNALTRTIEVPNQMNVGPRGARAVEPGLSKRDSFVGFCLFVLEKKDLMRVSNEKTVAEVYRYDDNSVPSQAATGPCQSRIGLQQLSQSGSAV